MRVPFSNLPAQYEALTSDIDGAIRGVLETGAFVLGPEVAAFEREFASFCGSPCAASVNSGTSALHLALLAVGVGPGAEVITVPMTFVATVAAIEYAGATPVFVDIEPVYKTIDVGKLAAAITPKTKAIIPVHLHGQACDMDAVLTLAHKHGLTVIEDAAQAHGASYHGKSLGTFGRFGCFSFYPGKNLGAAGEGGMVLCPSEDDANEIKMLRNWGSREKYRHEKRGFNYRLDSLQCAILRVKLRRLTKWTNRRREIASLYRMLLDDPGLDLPRERPQSQHAFHLFAVELQQRDQVAEEMSRQGIDTGIHYPLPVHLQPSYQDLGYSPGSFPESETMAGRTLSLPLYPEMTNEQVEYVAATLRKILKTHR